MFAKNVWVGIALGLLLGIGLAQTSKKERTRPAEENSRTALGSVEIRYRGQPANQFYFQTAEGVMGPFTMTPLPLPVGVYYQPTQVAVPTSSISPCAKGQWATSETHMYLCVEGGAAGKVKWRRLMFEAGEW